MKKQKYIFLADMFIEDYIGGAELTVEALLDECRDDVLIKRCYDVREGFILENRDKAWIIFNSCSLSDKNKLLIIKNVENYHCVEFDYKFCMFRNPKLHEGRTGELSSCSCETSLLGKINLLLFNRAKNLFFMSKKQKKIYEDKFPVLRKKKEVHVLSSVFDKVALGVFRDCLKSPTSEKKGWLILGSNSPVKDTAGCIDYAKRNNLAYSVVGGVTPLHFIQQMKESAGLIFLPRAYDTCPRVTIEAKLLGCKLVMNENVQHKDEEWFISEPLKILEYLEKRADFFWETINA